MRTRWQAYAGISAGLAAGVVVKALAQRPNFYSAAVYLSQSSANLIILSNMVFVAACTSLLGLQKLLYGPLRPIEIEQLYEKGWFAITETCLAATIFRGDMGARFLVMFFALLAGKVWSWIGEGRVEILEQQPPRNPRLFHTRLAISLVLSVLFSLTILEYVVKEVMHMARPDMMIMFGFEFAILIIISLSTAARYAINLTEIAIVRQQKAQRMDELRRERAQETSAQAHATQQESTDTAAAAVPPAPVESVDEADIEVIGWENKGRYMFCLDLISDFLKLVIYITFFIILLVFFGLPLNVVRDLVVTCRSFIKRVNDFLKYRTATRDMNERYPDATEQEIGREDVCIICREEMRPYQPPAEGQRQTNPVTERMRPKKLPCGHILHFSCLRSWLERQQICPTCRTSVVPAGQTASARAGGAANQDADAAVVPHRDAPDAEQARARVYQFGPLRIGVGAARGNNMLEDLQQQLGDGQARPPPQANGIGDAHANVNANANVNGPQQYGIGIRWDGFRRRERHVHDRRSIQEQLNVAARMIRRELNTLDQAMAELQVLRNMEAELARVRARRSDVATNPAQLNHLLHAQQSAPDVLVGSSQNNMLHAGSDQLPPGLTLPEGWTMMPLQPATAHAMHPVSGHAMPVNSQIPASAMFNMPRPPFSAPPVRQPQGQAQPSSTAMPDPQTNTSTAPTTAGLSQPAAATPPPPASLHTNMNMDREEFQNVLEEATRSANPNQPSSNRTTQITTSEHQDTTHAPPTINGASLAHHVDPTAPPGSNDSVSNGTSEPSTLTTQTLPLWGSEPASTPPELNQGGSSSRRHTGDDGAESSSSSTVHKRSATVEDLVDDDDDDDDDADSND